MQYPAKKDDVVEHAESEGGSEEVLDALTDIGDQEHDTPAAVSKAVSDQRRRTCPNRWSAGSVPADR